jgi:hypothetical protein
LKRAEELTRQWPWLFVVDIDQSYIRPFKNFYFYQNGEHKLDDVLDRILKKSEITAKRFPAL